MEHNIAIHGKKVKIVYNFDDYSKKLYRNDFKDFLEYQTKREEIDLKEEPRSIELKFLDIKELKNIQYRGLSKYMGQKYPYALFQKIVYNFLNRIILQILNELPQSITSEKEFEVQIKITRIPQREKYVDYDKDISDAEHAYIIVSGLWLINTVLVPWIHFKRIEYPIVYKYLLFHFQYHLENINRMFVYEKELAGKWKLKAMQISNYGVVFLLSSLLELRIDGFSEFLKKRNLGTFDIHANMIYEFRKNLAKLITIRKKQEAEEFFLSKLSYQSYVIQYCGSLMCCFIALSLTRNTIKKPIIIVGSEQHPLESISQIINSHENFFVQGLPEEVFNRAYALISKMGPIGFLNEYNQACDQFGIDYRNRVLWWKLFVQFKKATTILYEKERIKKLIKKGYRP